jgi:hypothetical protein
MPDAVLQDLRYALRAIRRSPGFAAVAILSLALGIGANTAIFSLIDSLILKTLPVAHPEQLLQVTSSDGAYFTNPIWEQIRGRQDVFSGVFAYGGNGFNLAAGSSSTPWGCTRSSAALSPWPTTSAAAREPRCSATASGRGSTEGARML